MYSPFTRCVICSVRKPNDCGACYAHSPDDTGMRVWCDTGRLAACRRTSGGMASIPWRCTGAAMAERRGPASTRWT
eukprot:scaffold32356_cov81-Phaeocystis_antarctica.AAC.1